MIMLKLLRNFGHLIRNLAVHFSDLNIDLCAGIESYLAKYCPNSLQRLALQCHRFKIPFENLQKPLRNVTALKVYTVRDQKWDHIQFLNEINLPNVQHINLSNKGCLQDSERIHYEYIERFEFVSLGTIDKFPFSFVNLKHLMLDGGIILNDELCNCINNIEHLRTLRIMEFRGVNSNSFRKLLELKNIQYNLEEVQFKRNANMLTDDILHFLKQSKKLRKYTIHSFVGNNEPEYVHIIPYYFSNLLKTFPLKLGVEWKIHYNDSYENPYDMYNKYECIVIEKLPN